LLCYRAETPTELFERQTQAWDPVLDWVKNHHQAPLVATRGIVPVKQPNRSLCNLKRALERFDSFQIAAFHDLVVLSGSLVLALAVTETELDCQQAWKISRIDEDWQENLWGADEEAQEAAQIKQESFALASKILQLLR